jgi:hypothetical protein
MTKHVVIDRTRTRLLPPNAPEKGFQITRDEAVKLGLLKAENEPQERRVAFDASKAKVPQVRRTKRK